MTWREGFRQGASILWESLHLLAQQPGLLVPALLAWALTTYAKNTIFIGSLSLLRPTFWLGELARKLAFFLHDNAWILLYYLAWAIALALVLRLARSANEPPDAMQELRRVFSQNLRGLLPLVLLWVAVGEWLLTTVYGMIGLVAALPWQVVVAMNVLVNLFAYLALTAIVWEKQGFVEAVARTLTIIRKRAPALLVGWVLITLLVVTLELVNEQAWGLSDNAQKLNLPLSSAIYFLLTKPGPDLLATAGYLALFGLAGAVPWVIALLFAARLYRQKQAPN